MADDNGMTRSKPNRDRSQFASLLTRLVAATFLLGLAGWLALELFTRGEILRRADEASVREWLLESRLPSKSVPELMGEYLERLAELPPDGDTLTVADEAAALKREELGVALFALGVPTREHQNQLLLFPKIYRLEVRVPEMEPSIEPVVWESEVPRGRPESEGPVRITEPIIITRSGLSATFTCEYELHAYNRLQQDAERAEQDKLLSAGLLIAAALLTFWWVYETWKQDWARQVRILGAEREAAESRSHRFAGISIMAGSYAHNIKNLLVRPNDLLDRLIGSSDLGERERRQIGEIKSTLSTVTDRLQEILRTVRRDPSNAQPEPTDLRTILDGIRADWQDMALEKWKFHLKIETPDEPMIVKADPSLLQQSVEILMFNARDAIFEMRNQIREEAYQQTDPEKRKRAIRHAASWKGTATIRVYAENGSIIFEVRDDGIGMTEDVRDQCMRTYFSTKRDNALYEGLNAGSGLGLSFVTAVLEQHQATIEMVSVPREGSTIRIRFPVG